MRKIAGICVALSTLLFACLMSPAAQAQRLDPEIQVLRSLLEKPDAEIDLARAKLVVDRLIDPSVDIEGTLGKLDAMAAAVKASVAPRAKSLAIAQTLRSYLYDAGPWNDHRPFRFDLEGDPLGHKISNKLLTNYLTTRKGNCVSMPTLFILLAQRLGLEATFATSPNHLFVKFRDEFGKWHNLETTSKGYPRRDELYMRDTPMTEAALRNGIYMRPLNKKESIVAAMVGMLLEFHVEAGRPEKVISVADLALEFYPTDPHAMLFKGSAYYTILRRDFLAKYPSPADIPLADRPRYQALSHANRLWFEKAEALGWREPDAGADARYLQMVKEARTN